MKKIQVICLFLSAMMMLSGCESSQQKQVQNQPQQQAVQKSQTQEKPQDVMDDILSQLPDEDKEKPPFYDTMEIKEGHFIFSLSTAQDLHDLSQWVSEGESTKNAVFVLKNDIDLQNEPFCPIGDEEHPFLGVFLGQGFQITNLNVQAKEKFDPAGLFGCLGGGATIEGLQLSGTVNGSGAVGGFVGLVDNRLTEQESDRQVTLRFCSFVGTVNGAQETGGFVGSAKQGATIESCFADAAVSAERSLGGFAGLVDKNAQIFNCYNLGEVCAVSESAEKEQGGIGGFVGTNRGDVFSSYCAAQIKSEQSARGIGGFVGNEGGGDYQCFYLLEGNEQWQDSVLTEEQATLSAKGLTDSQMRSQDSFSDWNFFNAWKMLPGEYPTLKEYQPTDVQTYIEKNIVNPLQGG